MPEQELKMVPFSILGKLRAEIGKFQAFSLLDPSLLVWGMTKTVIFLEHFGLCLNIVSFLEVGNSLFKTTQSNSEWQKISFIFPAAPG